MIQTTDSNYLLILLIAQHNIWVNLDSFGRKKIMFLMFFERSI